MRKYLLISLIYSQIFIACRGQKSDEPPIMPIRNMVEQTSYGPQSKNNFYKDGQAMRAPVAGTVALNQEKTDSRLNTGLEPGSTMQNPEWVKKFPVSVTESLMTQGKEKYNIYCAPCHGYTGHADGLVTQRAGGAIRPTNLHDKAALELANGKIYDAITNGVNNWNMPGFAAQISAEERWAIVAYVRALQLAEQATLENIPKNIQDKNGWNEKK